MMPANDLRGRTILVTGASGFLGRRLVAALAARGAAVRALVRAGSKVEALRLPGVKLCLGDVAEADSLESAFAGVELVVHAAADTSGDEGQGRRVTIGGTRNILAQCLARRVERLVYISSCSVYGVAELAPGQLVTEDAPLERYPERRGAYSWAKLEAENLVTAAMTQGETAVVCLRPGTIYGPGGENYTPMLGFALGEKLFALIGDGRMVLPLVHIDNLVAAILAALAAPTGVGGVYNVIDPERVDKRRYMEEFICRLHPGARCLYLPYGLLYGVTRVQEKLCLLLRRRPFLTCYRLTASQRPIIYDAARLGRELGWRPVIGFAAAAAHMVAAQQGRS